MGETYEARDMASLSGREYAALLIRVALGGMYLGHALMMWSIFGFEHAAHYATAVAEVLGGTLLATGYHVRAVALALIPVAVLGALLHVSTGVGMAWGYAAYLAVCLAGQVLLASGALRLDSPTMGDPRLQA